MNVAKSDERRVKGSRLIAALIEAKSLGEDWLFLTRAFLRKIEYIPSQKVAGEILCRY